MAKRLATTRYDRDGSPVRMSKKGRRHPGSGGMEAIPTEASVLEFDYGVKAYPPRQPDGYWRLRWEENHRHRDTTAKDRATAIAKAVEIVERMASGNPTELMRATGADLVAHYLDPRRRPPRVAQWSPKMREEQQRYCDKYVLPVIGTVRCRELGRADFQRVLDGVIAPSTAPKGRRRRVTMYPACTPGGVDLAAMVQRRLDELDGDELLFPAPTGGWARRSNYGRNLLDKAAEDVGWPRRLDRNGWLWTFHSLRHVFATWALAQPNIRIEDVSRLMGHSSIRVTQEIYVHVTNDVYDRLFDATQGGQQ